MDHLTTRLTLFSRIPLRPFLFSLVLLLIVSVTGCVSKEESDRRVREAVQQEQVRWAATVKGLREEKEKQKELADAEIAKTRADAEARIVQVQTEADEKVKRVAIENNKRGAMGLGVDVYQQITAPSWVSLVLLWLLVVVTLGALAAVSLWLIRDSWGWAQWIKLLLVPVSVYGILRFTPSFTSEIFPLGIVHEGVAELTLVSVGLVYAFFFDRYRGAQRRLLLDFVGLGASIVLLTAVTELFLFNQDLLGASGPSLGLKLAAGAPVGAAIYAIGRVVKDSVDRSIWGSDETEKAVQARPAGTMKMRPAISLFSSNENV